MVRLHTSLSEDKGRTSYLHIILLKVMLYFNESYCMSASRWDQWKRWRCSSKRHACLRTEVSSANIRCRVMILLLDANQSRVGGLFPSLFDLRYEFWRIQKLHERFEMWDRSARAISVVKENSIKYVRSLFFVSKIRQYVSFQYMILQSIHQWITWFIRFEAPRKRFQTSNPCMKDTRDLIGTVETRSRNIVEIRDDDFMIGKLMSSSPNSLSSKSFVSCPSKRNDRVQWEIIRSYDASFDEHDFELIIRIGDYYWVLSWVFQVNLMLTDRRRSLTDETHRTAVHILLT